MKINIIYLNKKKWLILTRIIIYVTVCCVIIILIQLVCQNNILSDTYECKNYTFWLLYSL